jgi:hypothetical protein
MRLVDNAFKHPLHHSLEMCEKAIEAVGLTQKSVQEFSTANIADFNKVAEDVEGVKYFSIASHKAQLQSSDILRQSHDTVLGPNNHEIVGGFRSDGLVRPEEAMWGRYLMTFPEHDHLEMAGFNSGYQPRTVYNLLVDNLRMAEIMEDPREARDYGVEQFRAPH